MRGDSQNKYWAMELAQNNILNGARLCDKRDTINQTSGAVEKQSERFVTGFAAKKIKDLNFSGNWKSREGTSPVRTRAEGAGHCLQRRPRTAPAAAKLCGPEFQQRRAGGTDPAPPGPTEAPPCFLPSGWHP